MRKLSMAVAVSSIALAAPGLAAADTFNYASFKSGVSQIRNNGFTVDAGTANQTGRVETRYHHGFNAALAVGRQYDIDSSLNIRTDVELGYSKNKAKSHKLSVVDRSNPDVPQTVSESSLPNPRGDLTMITGFVSVYGEKELEVIPNASFIFGAGGGGAQVSLEEYSGGGPIVMDDDDVTYGFHLTTGWSYYLTDTTALEATYRYMSIEEVELESEDGFSERQRIDSHHFMAGVRVGF
jgi:opacity protein-like surface antigen